MSSFSIERSQATTCLGWGLQDGPPMNRGQGEPQPLWWSLHRTAALARRAVLRLGSVGPSHTLLRLVDTAWTKIFTFTSVLTLPFAWHVLVTVLLSSCWPFCHVYVYEHAMPCVRLWTHTYVVAIYLEEEIPRLLGWKEAFTRAKEKVRRKLGVGGISCIANTCNLLKIHEFGECTKWSLNWSGYKVNLPLHCSSNIPQAYEVTAKTFVTRWNMTDYFCGLPKFQIMLWNDDAAF